MRGNERKKFVQDLGIAATLFCFPDQIWLKKKNVNSVEKRKKEKSFEAIMRRLLKHNEERHTAPMQELFFSPFLWVRSQTDYIHQKRKPTRRRRRHHHHHWFWSPPY